jgi:hypothetical protein
MIRRIEAFSGGAELKMKTSKPFLLCARVCRPARAVCIHNWKMLISALYICHSLWSIQPCFQVARKPAMYFWPADHQFVKLDQSAQCLHALSHTPGHDGLVSWGYFSFIPFCFKYLVDFLSRIRFITLKASATLLKCHSSMLSVTVDLKFYLKSWLPWHILIFFYIWQHCLQQMVLNACCSHLEGVSDIEPLSH